MVSLRSLLWLRHDDTDAVLGTINRNEMLSSNGKANCMDCTSLTIAGSNTKCQVVAKKCKLATKCPKQQRTRWQMWCSRNAFYGKEDRPEFCGCVFGDVLTDGRVKTTAWSLDSINKHVLPFRSIPWSGIPATP